MVNTQPSKHLTKKLDQKKNSTKFDQFPLKTQKNKTLQNQASFDFSRTEI